jgi:hypothetical protein
MTSPHVQRSRTLVYQHELWLKGIPTRIDIRVYKEDDSYYARTSHDIKTPSQASPYADTSVREDADYILHQAISGFTMFYGSAIDAGQTPDDSWLVPNTNPWA